MYFDRFDIVAAYYWFCAEHHSGQWSGLYATLSHITGQLKFQPSPLSRGPDNENQREIYQRLVRGDTIIRYRG